MIHPRSTYMNRFDAKTLPRCLVTVYLINFISFLNNSFKDLTCTRIIAQSINGVTCPSNRPETELFLVYTFFNFEILKPE